MLWVKKSSAPTRRSGVPDQNLYSQFLDIWRMPPRNDRSQIRYLFTLLQPRPRIPKQLTSTSWWKRQRTQRQRRRQRKRQQRKKQSHIHSTKEINAHTVSMTTRRLPLCMKYNAGECRRGDGCPYTSMLAQHVFKTEDLACRAHAAKDHRGSTWLEFDNYDAASQNYTPEIDTDIHSPSHSQDSSSQTASQPAINPRIASSNFPEKRFTTFHQHFFSTRLHRFSHHWTVCFKNQPVCSLTFFAGHSAPLSCAAKAANIDHFSPFDIDFQCFLRYNDDLFENLLKLAHSGLIGAVWSAPPCRLYSSLRKHDGGPLHWGPKNLLMVFLHSLKTNNDRFQESKEIHRRFRSYLHCRFPTRRFRWQRTTAQTPWHGKNLTANNSLNDAHCYFVATPACKWGLDFFNIGP